MELKLVEGAYDALRTTMISVAQGVLTDLKLYQFDSLCNRRGCLFTLDPGSECYLVVYRHRLDDSQTSNKPAVPKDPQDTDWS